MSEKKYEILKHEKLEYMGYTLYRIRALKDFGLIKKGQRGGWIQSEENLSQEGGCWVADEAKVFQNAYICDRAKILDKAHVFGNAIIESGARISREATISGRSIISGNSDITGKNVIEDSKIKVNNTIHGAMSVINSILEGYISWGGEATGFIKNSTLIDFIDFSDGTYYISDSTIKNAFFRGNAKLINSRINGPENGRPCIGGDGVFIKDSYVSGRAVIGGSAAIYRSEISDGVSIRDRAQVLDSKVKYQAVIQNDELVRDCQCIVSLKDNIAESLRCQCGLMAFDGKVIAYKRVRNDLSSFHDDNFKYEINKEIEAEIPETEYSNAPCAAGLHFSNMTYWDNQDSFEDSIYLIAEIKLEDIITVQKGKFRCKKAKIIGRYDVPAVEINAHDNES